MERQRVPVHSENSENSETLADQQESNDMIPQHSWNVALDIKNLSIGMPSVLQTLTEGMMSIYWLMALRAIDTANAMVLQRLEPILIKGPYTNFFFYVDGFVGLAVADTLQTRLFVHEFLPAFTGFIYYGHVTDPVLPLDVNQYIRLLKNQRDVKWYTWSHRPNVQDA